jgi:ribosomal protein L27
MAKIELNVPYGGMAHITLLRLVHRALGVGASRQDAQNWIKGAIMRRHIMRRRGRYYPAEKSLASRDHEIYALVPQAPKFVGYRVIAKKLSIDPRDVTAYLRRLHKKGLIRRIGTGIWTRTQGG